MISKNDIVLSAEIHYEETLDGILLMDPKMEVDLIMDHSSLVVGSIGISSKYGFPEFFSKAISSSG